MPNLIVERGRERGMSFELTPGTTLVVGRDPQASQFVIADAAASRRHFQVAPRDGKWFVSDLGSKNFTFVNEEKCERETELVPGDRIQVGETVFSFNDDEKVQEKSAGLSGKEIGGYRILERIGRGGMGTVYKAKQISLNRLVALKLLSSKFARDPAFVERFFAEARAAAQLNHPNVVQVFDVGTLSGVHFFSMEFMEGGCVQDLLTAREDSRLPWQEAIPLILDSTRGLVFAEKRGIIHRDIKPDNLMLTSEQKVKIGDLGLAKKAEDSGEKGIFGTPHFIAPEQAQGKEVTHAADIYSLGATFYRVVTGRTPFGGQTVKDILRAQINDAHTPIPQLVPGFPADLAAIVDKMMAKKPEARYQSATQLLQDLEAFQIAHQIELAGGVKSRKPFLVAMGVLGVALVGVVVWAVTRPKDIEIREKPGETKIVEVGPKGPVKTEEDIRREAENAATIDLLTVRGDDRALGADVALEQRDAWTAIADRYDGVASKHPKAATQVGEAKARAQAIRDEIARLEKLKAEVLDKAQAWWAQTDGAVKAAFDAGRWNEAMRLAAAALAAPELEKFLPHLPADAKSKLTSLPDACFAAAGESLQKLQLASDAKIAAGDAAGAMADADAWEKALRAQEFQDTRFTGLADQVRTWRERRSEDVEARLRDALAADKNAWIDAYRRVRHVPRDATTDGGPVFAYRFAAAAAELRTAAAAMKTWHYRERAEAKAAQLDATQAAWDAFVRLVGERKLFAAGEEIKGMPGVSQGTKCSVDPDRPATSSEFYFVNSVLGGSSKKSVDWAEFTPDEISRIFVLPKADRIPADLVLPLARLFAELGASEAAATLLDRAKGPVGETVALRAEVTAMQAYETLRAAPLDAPAEVVRAVEQWRNTHLRTDFFVLADGRSAQDTPQLLTDDEVERFVTLFGVRPAER